MSLRRLLPFAIILTTLVRAAPFPGSTSDWNGFKRFDFQVADRPAIVVVPGTAAPAYRSTDLGGEASPNGNTVSLEQEMVRGTQAKSNHDLALTVYKTSLDIIRTSLGRGR